MAKRKRVENNVHPIRSEHDQNKQILKTVKSVVKFAPKNLTQARLVKSIENPNNHIIFALGPSGTGKTYIIAKYAIQQLVEGKINKIVITRPTVAAGEDIGFLPGALEDKMEPWLLPIYDVFMEHEGITRNEIRNLIAKGTIEIVPFAFMRGRSLKNSVIIADEMQNASVEQIKMLLTRIGEDSKILLTGDLEQTDYDRRTRVNGLGFFLDKFSNFEGNKTGIEVIRFEKSEILRHQIIDKVLDIFG